MTVIKLAEFFGKSERTIRRYCTSAGIVVENGVKKEFTRDEVEILSKALFKVVPEAVKEAISVTFTASAIVQAQALPNAEVTGKRHSDVCRDIASQIGQLANIKGGVRSFAHTYKNEQNGITRLDDDEKGVVSTDTLGERSLLRWVLTNVGGQDELDHGRSVPHLFGGQAVEFCNQGRLKANGNQFFRWHTSVVGCYTKNLNCS